MSKILHNWFNGFLKIGFCCIVFTMLFTSCEEEPSENESDEIIFQSDELNDSLNLKCWKSGRLVGFELISSYTVDQLKAILGPSFESIINYDVDLYKISYLSMYKGRIVKVSGAVGLPELPYGVRVPVAMYNHGTRITEADQIPSGGMDIITLLTASYGYISFAADYVGFGDSKNIFHPYLINSASDPVVCDMIFAGEKFLKLKRIRPLKDFFMFGFSQGGLVTMSAQKLIENNPLYRNRIKLTAVAMATGPYDLHEHAVHQIISADSYPAPAFILFSFISYNIHYNIGMDLDDIFKNGYGQLFLDLREQGMGFDEINAYFPTELSNLFQDEFRNDFLAGETIFNILFQHNSAINGWIPETTTRIYSSPADEIVPYANAQVAYETFVAAGSQCVELITLPPVDHVTSAFMSYLDILTWFDSF